MSKEIVKNSDKVSFEWIHKVSHESECDFIFKAFENPDETVTIKVLPKDLLKSKNVIQNNSLDEARKFALKYRIIISIIYGLISYQLLHLTFGNSNIILFTFISALLFSILLFLFYNPILKSEENKLLKPPCNEDYSILNITLTKYHYEKFQEKELRKDKNPNSGHNYLTIEGLNSSFYDLGTLTKATIETLSSNAKKVTVNENAFKEYKNAINSFKNLSESEVKNITPPKSPKEHTSSLNERNFNMDSFYKLNEEELDFAKVNNSPKLFMDLSNVYEELSEEEKRNYNVCLEEWVIVKKASLKLSVGAHSIEQEQVLNNVTSRINKVLEEINNNYSEKELLKMKQSELFLKDKYKI